MAENSGAPPIRLADYFAVIGFDDSKERNGVSVGRIIQRFPEADWIDVPFFQGLELFCQPQGWRISVKRQPATFFIGVLTDIGADRHYVACLSFSEARFGSENPALNDDDELENGVFPETELSPSSADSNSLNLRQTGVNSVGVSPIMYLPKCLVLVSRYEYFEAFRNCLTTIYTAYVEKMPVELELLVSNLVSGVHVHPPGGSVVKFSLGAGDRQAVQPPASATIPITNMSVVMLFQQLGIYNVLCLFSAVLTDRKILFSSQSYTRLTEAAHALSSLIYPLKYSYVYVPILPGALVEVLQSPTPFIMGLHVSYKPQLIDLVEIICVDLDNGNIYIPDSITVPPLPEPYQYRLQTCLTLVLNKDLYTADYAFGQPASSPGINRSSSTLSLLDKQIRACFLRFFGELFTDYRLCLKIVRIYPKPFLAFHKAAFLGMRGFQDDDFMNRLIDSMSFQSFVTDRGPSYRVCDLFDEVYSSIQKTLLEENDDKKKVTENLLSLAQQLQNNEQPSGEQILNKVPAPTELSDSIVSRVIPPFPILDAARIRALVDANTSKFSQQNPTGNGTQSSNWNRTGQLREVPNSTKTSSYLKSVQFSGNLRRLDVLKNCLKCIFENKISDARKMLSAVLLSMKSNVIRVAFCQELYSYLHLHSQNRAAVEAQQFDLLVRLMNCALQHDSAADEYGVAYAMLLLATTYCRRLSTGVVQFAYTCVQDHAVWQNQQFWEAAFYHDIHLQLKDLYASSDARKLAGSPFGSMPSRDAWNLHEEPCTLKVAAEKLRGFSRMSSSELLEAAKQEEAIIFSQAIHYANRIVYFRVPMDANKLRRVNIRSLEQSSSASVSNVSSVENASRDGDSTTESDVESGYVDGDGGVNHTDLGQGTVRWILKFMDKICSEAGLGNDINKMRQLHQMVPGVVAMHIETIENVYRESRKLPPINKPRMLVPAFLPAEQMLQGYLRVYLLPDGRQEAIKSSEKAHSSCLLPAEGAIFMTNYRVIFKGQPCDPYLCEHIVLRVIPVMAITKYKRIGQQYLSGFDQSGHYFHDALQIRSATFQLMRIAFDEEVGQEKVQTFCQALEQLRWPENLFDIFALSSTSSTTAAVADSLAKQTTKNSTLRGFAKKTLLRTVQKAGVSVKSLNSTTNYSTPSSPGGSSTLNRSSHLNVTVSNIRRSTLGANSSVAGSDSDGEQRKIAADNRPLVRTLDRLAERAYCRDYQRLGLCTKAEVTMHSSSQSGMVGGTSSVPSVPRCNEGQFRLTVINRNYSVCQTYPSVFVVPAAVSDDSIKKLAKGHKHSRFPVVTWCSENGALLLRGAGFQTRSVVSRWKHHQASHNMTLAVNSGTMQHSQQQQIALKSSVEQEKYFNTLVHLSPNLPLSYSGSRSDSVGSLLSFDSLLWSNIDASSLCSSYSNTPDVNRKPFGTSGVASGSHLQKLAVIRSSGGKSSTKSLNSRFNFRSANSSKTSTLSTASSRMAPSVAGTRRSSVGEGALARPGSTTASQMLRRASLYVFGEKNQTKAVKLDPNCQFIPIEFPEAHLAKESLKKFLRAVAPSMLPVSDGANTSFLKALDESGWLQVVSSLLQIASAIVDIIDMQNSSVAVCLEYGWDATTQIVSLAQLMLDPYYRTIDGFRTLVEKEWLSFGHRFSHRCNHTLNSSTSGFAPMFLMFLDAVHQMYVQYPGAFEFNDFYLRYLAYHSTAAFFRSFLMDCEKERAESGLLQSEGKSRPRPELSAYSHHHHDESPSGIKKRGLLTHHGLKNSGNSISGSTNHGSIWDYIDERHQRSCLFYNFHFTSGQYKVLRPHTSMASLDVWDYYNEDSLAYGNAYDLDAAETELEERQTDRSDTTTPVGSADGVSGKWLTCGQRLVVDAKYDGVDFTQDTVFRQMLDEIYCCERDLDVLPQKWSAVLINSKHGIERQEEESAQISATVEWASWLSRTLHKKATIELLLRGRLLTRGITSTTYGTDRLSLGDSDGRSTHVFQKYNPTAPEHCHVCNRILWSVVRQGLRCSNCEFSCHEKCVTVASPTCSGALLTRNTAIGHHNVAALHTSTGSGRSTDIGDGSPNNSYDQFVSPPVETRTHEGYLMKRGHLLKAWKQRWFVLDSIKHQLRYFDAMEDSFCKGYIDLADVTGIGPAPAPPGTPKHLEGSFFDLKTIRRVYNFMANNSADAHMWIEKIQACLQ